MTHRLFLTAGVALAALFTPLAAPAQTAETPTTETPTTEGQPDAAVMPYLAATHGDWQVICTRAAEDAPEFCEGYQLLSDAQGSPIAEFSLEALPLGAEFAAGATITTPLETFLPTGLGFRVGDAEEMRLEPFRVCTVVGCIVRMGVTFEEVDAMKAGTTATLTIAPFVQVDQPVDITVSLSGFTAMFEDLQTRLSLAAAAARSGN